MRQLQVTVPEKFRDSVEEVLEKYTSDVSSSEVEKDDTRAVEFTATSESEDIDELSQELKEIEDLGLGELSIRVLEQESLIEKGQKTRGSSSTLSQEEIYSKAQEFSDFSGAQWALIAVSSAIAAYGLALDNIIVVIGAMMLAPMLSPFVSGAVSLVVGDRSLMEEAMENGLKSIFIAVIVSSIAVLPFPVESNGALELVVSPSILTVLLSLLVGSAAALSFATGFRDQIAGVAVAIALVPPLAAIGIGLKMQNLVFVAQAASIASINILAVIVSGSLTFRLLGLKPSTYYREKEAETMRYVVPVALLILLFLAIPVGYSSYLGYQDYLEKQEVRHQAEEFFGTGILEVSFEGEEPKVIVVGEHNVTDFKNRLDRNITVRQLRTE